ncbi:MAG TPA: 50S ribosomal protein L3 [Candidatus Glassbacteria bacterium]|nr:50S ribosomal protein L3 [Candidatus Glassbacteria bacterium]
MLGMIGKKLGMTRIFDENGMMVPVTVIQTGSCLVTQVKTVKSDGYNALQVGFGVRKEKNVPKPLLGHLAKVKGYCPEALGEFRLEDVSGFEVGQEIKVEIFSAGEGVNVRGVTKGRGFQGVVKRHHFAGGDEGHGCDSKRVPGSVGASADPSRVLKNKRLPGHHGNTFLKVLNLKVAKVDSDHGYLFVRGAVPGPASGLVTVWKNK